MPQHVERPAPVPAAAGADGRGALFHVRDHTVNSSAIAIFEGPGVPELELARRRRRSDRLRGRSLVDFSVSVPIPGSNAPTKELAVAAKHIQTAGS